MTNILNGARCYLSGPMDYVKDRGMVWRDDFSIFLKSLNIKPFHPGRKPTQFASELDVAERRAQLLSQGDYFNVATMMKEIVRYDLRMVDISDFLVLFVNPNVHMCGSYWEATYAILQKKPVLTVVEGGIEKMPYWLFGVLNLDEVFNSFEDCKSYITKISNETINLPRGWRIFQWDKI